MHGDKKTRNSHSQLLELTSGSKNVEHNCGTTATLLKTPTTLRGTDNFKHQLATGKQKYYHIFLLIYRFIFGNKMIHTSEPA